MKLTRSEDNRIYTLESENRSVDLTAAEVALIANQFMKFGLRDSIEYHLRDADGDWIDLEKAPDGFDSLVEEIYSDLEDDVDYGDFPTDKDIDEKICDLANFYDMTI